MQVHSLFSFQKLKLLKKAVLTGAMTAYLFTVCKIISMEN
jgi:hypothetical protein